MMKLLIYILIAGVVFAGSISIFFIYNSKKPLQDILIETDHENKLSVEMADDPPEISGWIAWWKEEEAYDLIQRRSSKIASISPVWFFINEDLDLVDVGKVDRRKVADDMKNFGILLVPCLGSALDSEGLSLFLNNQSKVDSLIDNLVFQLSALGAYGVDIDLEGIKKEDRDLFSQFLFDLKVKLKEKDIKLYVAVHAQTEKVEWEGVLGQDLEKIGEAADYVRIMTYDKHSGSTKAGAVSPIAWMKDVALYNSGLIEMEKIVIGIPSYSYVWTDEGCESFQFDELNKYLEGKSYSQKRDRESGELIFKSDELTAWLSDSQAMATKIESLRDAGFNKFVIWSLGGMDERFFEQN